jgi:predicted PurR-regulated permease PerM
LTIALINCGLGLVIGLGLWAIGMPDPLVWGVAAALLNFLPYIGALTGIVTVGVISLVTFQSFGYALMAPLFYFAAQVLEGQFITPMIVGRRQELNSVSIFIALAFWTWLWGPIGSLIAVPLLVVVKVFCDHFDGLQHLGNFLSAQQAAEEDE